MMGMSCTPEFYHGEETIMMTEFCGVKVDPVTGGAEQKMSNIIKRGHMANICEFKHLKMVTLHATSIINSLFQQNQSPGFTSYVRECSRAWYKIIDEAERSGQFKNRALKKSRENIDAMSYICQN